MDYISSMKYSFKNAVKPYFGILFLFCLLLQGCIDPVTPEFQYQDGQIYIDAFASTAPGGSYVTINKSNTEFGLFRSIHEEGAQVSFKNTDTDQVVDLIELDEIYVPPNDFSIGLGETWELQITLSNGKQIRSEPETVVAPVPLKEVTAIYDPELKYSEAYGRAVPGHSVSVSFDDPVDEVNYYYWRFKSFETLPVCRYCPYGKLRDGNCINDIVGYSYPCDVDCWRIRYNEDIKIFADEFTNGKTISNLPIADVLLYTDEDILVRIDQFALSPKAYRYFKTLKDLVDNNAGINAPPPAALVGNMFNVTDDEDLILGRFTATATATFSVFIDRSNIPERALETVPPFRLETGLGTVVVTAPCIEGKYRTTVQPEGWIYQ